MSRKTAFALFGLALATVTCKQDAPLSTGPIQASIQFTSGIFVNSDLDRDEVVAVHFLGNPSSAQKEAVLEAMGTWATVFRDDVYNLPQVSITEDDPQADEIVEVEFASREEVPSTYCGGATRNPMHVILTPSQDNCGGGGPWTLVRIARHEIGEALGFADMGGLGSAVDYCIAKSPSNDSPCPHEIQGVWYYYGVRTTDPDVTQALIDEFEILADPDTINLGQMSALSLSPSVAGNWSTTSEGELLGTTQGTATATVRGVAAGTATITVTLVPAANVSWPSPFTSLGVPVIGPIASITVWPLWATKSIGQQQQFAAQAWDAGNHPLSGYAFSWASSNEAVATVNVSGLATAVGSGSATISASYGTISGNGTLYVAALVVEFGSSPNPVRPNRTCSWSATASGGTGPYTYAWFKPPTIEAIASGQSVNIATGTKSFWLRVRAYDSLGGSAVDSTYVTVSSSSPYNCTY